jgi:hypothetical protein
VVWSILGSLERRRWLTPNTGSPSLSSQNIEKVHLNEPRETGKRLQYTHTPDGLSVGIPAQYRRSEGSMLLRCRFPTLKRSLRCTTSAHMTSLRLPGPSIDCDIAGSIFSSAFELRRLLCFLCCSHEVVARPAICNGEHSGLTASP